jgi:hypothetical protein
MTAKKQFEVINVPNDGEPKWYGGAFTLAFVYSNKGNFLVKGYDKEVEQYIKTHFTRYFVRMVLYGKGEHRDIFHFGSKCNLALDAPHFKRSDYHNKYRVRPYGYGSIPLGVQLTFKRFPTKWIPEFDYMVDKFGKKNNFDDDV